MSDKPEPRASDSVLADELEAVEKCQRRTPLGLDGHDSATIYESGYDDAKSDIVRALTALRSNAGKASHE